MTLVTSPLVPGLKLKSDTDNPLPDPSINQRLNGKLNYLTNTRTNLAFSTQHLSQFIAKPCSTHFDATMHVLKYVKNNLDQASL